MKRTKFALVLACLVLILITILSACGGEQAGTTATTTVTAPGATTTVTATGPAVKTVFKVLNPVGNYIPVETKPLAPRLDTLDGKKIYFTESEANPRIMPALLKRMKETYTKTEFVYTATASFGDSNPSEDMLKNAQGYIRGISW